MIESRIRSYPKRYHPFAFLRVTMFFLLMVVLASFCLTVDCSSAEVEVESLQQKETKINECTRKIVDYDRNKNVKKYSQKQLEELLRCVEFIDAAAKQQIREPNTIFRSQQQSK